MALSAESYLQFTPDMRICRLLNGLWQLSGAHGPIDRPKAIASMFDYLDAGLITWDLADHYGPAEDFIGELRQHLTQERGPAALDTIQAFTKWVPRPRLRITRQVVEQAIEVSLRRMATSRLDLLQFHWWEYADRGYIEALKWLAELVEAGQIRHLSLTNFDTTRLQIITGEGLRIVSNQVQYSLIDRRPEVQMADFCRQHNIWLLTYGTLCGGLLSERYLGQPEPRPAALNTASLRKYKQMIDLWGGWALFQQLLTVLKAIADKHSVSVANVAVRTVLDRPQVAGVIVGARLGLSQNIADNLRVFNLRLDEEDRARLDEINARANDLYRIIGDCGDEYRR